MKADLISLDAHRAEREQRFARTAGREAVGLSARATAALVGAAVAIIACGFVAAALWLVWMLAGGIP